MGNPKSKSCAGRSLSLSSNGQSEQLFRKMEKAGVLLISGTCCGMLWENIMTETQLHMIFSAGDIQGRMESDVQAALDDQEDSKHFVAFTDLKC